MALTNGRSQYPFRSGRIIQNVADQIIQIDKEPENAAFTAFFNTLPSEETRAEQFKWDTDEYFSLTDTTTAAATATATTIAVTDGTQYIPNQLWRNSRTGEIFLVLSVAGNNVTAYRGMGSTAAAAMNSGDTLFRLAPAVGENSTRQVTQTTTPTEVSNYCQVFRQDLSMSQRQMKRAFESGGGEWMRQYEKQIVEFRRAISRALLYGQQARRTVNGEDVTLTDGLASVISTNTLAAGGTLYEYAFDEFLDTQAFRYGKRQKVAFCSLRAIAAITQMAKDRVVYDRYNNDAMNQNFGFKVPTYMSTFGELVLVHDRNITEAENGAMYIVDPSQLVKKVFSGNGYTGDIHWIEGTQNNDDMGYASTLYADMGLQWGAEVYHAKITGITAGAAGRGL